MESILKQLIDRGIIENNVVEYKSLHGGTSSQLRVICMGNGQKFVVKSNDRNVIEAESDFLTFYQDIQLFPKLIYTDPTFKYIVYTYVEGETNSPFRQKANHLEILVQKVINHYKPASISYMWGYLEAPVHSWHDFLLSEVKVAGERLHSILSHEDYQLVMSLINSNRNEYDTPYLLHGDCGIHNFLFENGNLSGVIDPTPILGKPIYDLIYAFCSSPDELKKETIMLAAKALNNAAISEELLCEEVIIGLYIRLSRCAQHHPDDLPEYLKAWNEWKGIYKGNGGNEFGEFI
jgi:hypothetical protein